jgi:hypothetical protein
VRGTYDATTGIVVLSQKWCESGLSSIYLQVERQTGTAVIILPEASNEATAVGFLDVRHKSKDYLEIKLLANYMASDFSVEKEVRTITHTRTHTHTSITYAHPIIRTNMHRLCRPPSRENSSAKVLDGTNGRLSAIWSWYKQSLFLSP